MSEKPIIPAHLPDDKVAERITNVHREVLAAMNSRSFEATCAYKSYFAPAFHTKYENYNFTFEQGVRQNTQVILREPGSQIAVVDIEVHVNRERDGVAEVYILTESSDQGFEGADGLVVQRIHVDEWRRVDGRWLCFAAVMMKGLVDSV